jgi:hypothetical protein
LDRVALMDTEVDIEAGEGEEAAEVVEEVAMG